MALVKVKPTSAGRRVAGQGRQRRPAQGRAGRVARRSAEARLGPQQQRPHHDPPQGRRPQAPLPRRRLPAQQGRHRREGRAPRVRPEPQRQHRAAAATPTASAATSSRRAASRSARSSCRASRRRSSRATRCRCATSRSARRCTASRCSPARARRSRARRAPSVQLLAREGIYAQLRLRSGEIRKVHVDCRADDRRSRQRGAQPALDRQGGRASAGAASVRRCAASR